VKAQSLASRRRAVLVAFLAVLGFAVAGLAGAGPAMAKDKTCAEQVVDDWYDNQRVDKLYPVHCYREAIANLPLDITDYSDAKEAILRALAYREAGLPDPGAGRSTVDSTVKPIAYRHTADVVVAIKDRGTQQTSTNTAGPSSVPVPLIVLAGLAGLLLLAGGAGYVARRLQARRGGPPPAA
jgi:hypothetical protein